jgi:hypothetical protein
VGTDQSETFRAHLPALAASILGTLTATILASHLFGTSGTRYGLLFGGLISGTISWWAERGIRNSQELAKAKIKAARDKGAPLSATETSYIEVAYANKRKRTGGIHYRTIILLALFAIAVCVSTVATLDKFGARQVASFTPAPAPTVTHTQIVPQAPTTVTVDPTIVQTVTPAVTATVHSASASASATPFAQPDSTPPTSSGVTSSVPSTP